MSIDIGDKCTSCGRDTSFGSGLFVNRVPSGAYDEERGVEITGYMCIECQTADPEDYCNFYCPDPDCICDNLSLDQPCDDCQAGQHIK